MINSTCLLLFIVYWVAEKLIYVSSVKISNRFDGKITPNINVVPLYYIKEVHYFSEIESWSEDKSVIVVVILVSVSVFSINAYAHTYRT